MMVTVQEDMAKCVLHIAGTFLPYEQSCDFENLSFSKIQECDS